MRRLVNVDTVKNALDDGWRPDIMVSELWEIVDCLPSFDAADIVRCKDCLIGAQQRTDGKVAYVTCSGKDHAPDWFCADGIKRGRRGNDG